MASHAYDTTALILSRAPWGEGSSMLTVLTERLGLIRAVGRAAREERSKMRGNLQPLTLLRLTLVRGEGVWRVTGAQEATLFGFTLSPPAKELLTRILLLAQRLVHGEEGNGPLFAHIRDTLALLAEPLSPQDYDSLEIVSVVRVLESLGYKVADTTLAPLMRSPMERELLSEVPPLRRKAIQAINETLRETQL